jgi:hypothetical protein
MLMALHLILILFMEFFNIKFSPILVSAFAELHYFLTVQFYNEKLVQE